MYFCRECQLILCHQCESREGPRHPHPFYKILNKNQFEHLNIGGVSSIEKFMDGVGDTMEKGYNSILGWFGARNEESNNRNNRQVIQGPQWVSLVQIARASYDLRNFSDKQIEDALIKAGDKFFYRQNLCDMQTITHLYKIIGERYGLDGYRFDVFHDYDGYGHVVFRI